MHVMFKAGSKIAVIVIVVAGLCAVAWIALELIEF
jgi:hypothetical protein